MQDRRTHELHNISLHFSLLFCVVLQVTIPKNGEDVDLKLVLHSESTAAMKLHISIGVQAMTYNNKVAVNIQEDKVEKTLQPGDGESSSVNPAVSTDVAILKDFHI